ncbi:aspartate/glutamate racemase family protein [Ekhidna sp.]
MRKLGLIGGTSWHSSIEYYSSINQSINDHFGDNTNPPIVLYTLNQSQIHKYQKEDKWEEVAKMLTNAALDLEKAGAEAVMFCANTPHKVYDTVNDSINVPILHIAEATAKSIISNGIKIVCFIGTRFTMEESYIIDKISRNGVEVLVPKKTSTIEELHRIIQEELTFGISKDSSKEYVMSSLDKMISQGAKGVILGCTEFPLMIAKEDLSVPIFNTVKCHSEAAVKFILG